MIDQQSSNRSAPMSSRKTTNVFIALFLLAQIVVPLRYYLGSRSADERFSWRMFSSYGMQHAKHDALTQVSVRETALENGRLVERSVDLPTILPKRWIQYLRHEPVGFFITWTCYGTRLHGDACGSVDDQHNVYGTPLVPVQHSRAVALRERLTHRPVRLTNAARSIDRDARERVPGRPWINSKFWATIRPSFSSRSMEQRYRP